MAEQPPLPASFNDAETRECTLTITNSTGTRMQLIWVNFEGVEQLYNLVDSNTETHQGTFDTHVWLLKDEDGNLLLQYSGPSATITCRPSGVAVTVKRPGAASTSSN